MSTALTAAALALAFAAPGEAGAQLPTGGTVIVGETTIDYGADNSVNVLQQTFMVVLTTVMNGGP